MLTQPRCQRGAEDVKDDDQRCQYQHGGRQPAGGNNCCQEQADERHDSQQVPQTEAEKLGLVSN